jgi:hypothetical protein
MMSRMKQEKKLTLLVLLLITLLLWHLLHALLPGLLGPLLEAACNMHIRKEENMMKTNCPFLEPLRRPQAGDTHGCGAGINFYPVGKDRERCRVCSIAALGRLPDCQYLDANAWLQSHQDGSPFVDVKLLCGLTDDPLPDLRRCARCPERLPQATGSSRPAMAPALSLALAG